MIVQALGRPVVDALPPHAAPAAEVARGLGSHLERGLTSDEAATRLAAAGPNRLESPSRPRYLAIAGRQLADPLVALLLAAAVVSFAIGEEIEAAVIAAIVVLNGLLGFAQEASAERAVIALGAGVEEQACRSCATDASSRYPSRASCRATSFSCARETASQPTPASPSPRASQWTSPRSRASRSPSRRRPEPVPEGAASRRAFLARLCGNGRHARARNGGRRGHRPCDRDGSRGDRSSRPRSRRPPRFSASSAISPRSWRCSASG